MGGHYHSAVVIDTREAKYSLTPLSNMKDVHLFGMPLCSIIGSHPTLPCRSATKKEMSQSRTSCQKNMQLIWPGGNNFGFESESDLSTLMEK